MLTSSKAKQNETTFKGSFLHLAGALMEHFIEGIAPSKYWYGTLTQMRRVSNTNLLF